MGREFEKKYRASADILDAVRQRYGNFTAIAMATTYYDVPGRELSRRRWTLRLRQENDRTVCTLKIPLSDGSRGEWEVIAPSLKEGIAGLLESGAPKELTAVISGGLEPVCGARFLRLARSVTYENAALELALDSGELLGGGNSLPFWEIEVELKSGSDQAAEAFGEALRQEFRLTEEPESKFQRARKLGGIIMYNADAYALGTNRSAIRDLFEYGLVRAAVVGQDHVYDFSLGNPSIPSPPQVDEAIRDLLATTDSLSLHGYTSAVGDQETRDAIAQDLNRRYHASTRAEDFFLTCGAAPALTAIFRALAVPGGELLVISPYFPEYKPFAQQAGLIFREVPPDIPDFQVNLSAVECMLTPATQAVLVNSPNNPSGVVYTRQTLTALAGLLGRKSREYGHPIYLISDEPYRELAYGVEVPFLPLIYPNTLVCYSYSKSLSLPGERIGYVYVPETAENSRELYAAIAGAARAAGHVCAPSLWQKVIARCVSLRPDLNAYDRNRRALYDGLTSIGYEAAKPDGAFYLFVKAPGGDAAAFSEKAKGKDLLVVPGDSFGCPGYVRLCYCVSYQKIVDSLPVFQSLFSEYNA